MQKDREMDEYFRGERLYGDDFSYDEIREWFKDEEYGYYGLGQKSRENYVMGIMP